MLQIKQIDRLEPTASSESLRVLFADIEPITVSFERDLTWLESAMSTGRPVAVDLVTKEVLPATVAFEVQLREADPEEPVDEIALSVFAPPRPAQLYVRKDMDATERLVDLLEEAIAQNKGAVLAVRDVFWIEDVVLIDPEDGMKMNGMAVQ